MSLPPSVGSALPVALALIVALTSPGAAASERTSSPYRHLASAPSTSTSLPLGSGVPPTWVVHAPSPTLRDDTLTALREALIWLDVHPDLTHVDAPTCRPLHEVHLAYHPEATLRGVLGDPSKVPAGWTLLGVHIGRGLDTSSDLILLKEGLDGRTRVEMLVHELGHLLVSTRCLPVDTEAFARDLEHRFQNDPGVTPPPQPTPEDLAALDAEWARRPQDDAPTAIREAHVGMSSTDSGSAPTTAFADAWLVTIEEPDFTVVLEELPGRSHRRSRRDKALLRNPPDGCAAPHRRTATGGCP